MDSTEPKTGARNHWIDEWHPDDEQFWKTTGKRIARRNLFWSILAEHIGFSVWLIWSVVATQLPKIGFPYSTEQLFSLVALPGLIGSLMRFPYTFAVPRFGGRNWTIVSAALLFIPTTLAAILVTRPATPYWLMALAAATAGLGGGNFASSMSNISFFYPDREKGYALGLNAAGGNIGVSTVQFLIPIVLGLPIFNLYMAAPQGPKHIYLENAGLFWYPRGHRRQPRRVSSRRRGRRTGAAECSSCRELKGSTFSSRSCRREERSRGQPIRYDWPNRILTIA